MINIKITYTFVILNFFKMEYSLTQYATLVGKTRQAIFYQIKNNVLPKGVKAKKIGNAIVITVKK